MKSSFDFCRRLEKKKWPFCIILIFLFLSPDSSNTYGSSSIAFIFSLRNKEGLAPFKSIVIDSQRAIYRGSGYGPTFGTGHQIYIANNANSNSNSYTDFGQYNCYSVPSGVQSKYTILAGTNYFTPDEVEVFYLGWIFSRSTKIA